MDGLGSPSYFELLSRPAGGSEHTSSFSRNRVAEPAKPSAIQGTDRNSRRVSATTWICELLLNCGCLTRHRCIMRTKSDTHDGHG